MDGDTPLYSVNRGIKRMRTSGEGRASPTKEQLEICQVLYPIFKDEVYRRREQMIQLTAFSSAFLLFVLIMLYALSSWSAMNTRTPWFVISGVVIFSSLVAFLIRQHANRHQMAKQQLIELEQSMEFYEHGWQRNGEALYPQNWKFDWAADRSVTLYLTILAIQTLLIISALLIWA